MDDPPQPELDAEEARWREIIRVAVEMAFASRRVVVSLGVTNHIDLLGYGRT